MAPTPSKVTKSQISLVGITPWGKGLRKVPNLPPNPKFPWHMFPRWCQFWGALGGFWNFLLTFLRRATIRRSKLTLYKVGDVPPKIQRGSCLPCRPRTRRATKGSRSACRHLQDPTIYIPITITIPKHVWRETPVCQPKLCLGVPIRYQRPLRMVGYPPPSSHVGFCVYILRYYSVAHVKYCSVTGVAKVKYCSETGVTE
jgi:hypothetical protein